MKKIVLLIALSCSVFSAAAQPRPGYDQGYRPGYGPGSIYGQSYGPGYQGRPGYGPGYGPGYYSYGPDQRVEIGVGLTGIGDIAKVYRNTFAELYGEYRGYLNDWFDVGIQLFFTGGRGTASADIFSPGGPFKLFQTGWEGILDWNFLMIPNMTAFLGYGVGRTYGYFNYPSEDFSGWTRGWCLDPRIGLELFDRLRITAHLRCSFADRIGTYGAISIGWCFDPTFRRYYGRSQQPRDPSTMQPRIR